MKKQICCSNCGAYYDADCIVCPFCGEERIEGAKQEHIRELNEVKSAIAEEKKKPEKYVHKATWYMVRGLLGAAVLFILLLLINWIVSFFSASRAIERQKENLARLEMLYQASDYEAMDEYLDGIEDSYSATYGKYYNIAHAYIYLELATDACRNTADFFSKGTPGVIGVEDFLTNLNYAMKVFLQLQDMQSKGYLYDEQEACESFRKQAIDMLKDTMLLTEEEILEGVDRAIEYQDKDRKADLSDLAQQSLERMKEKWR